MATFCEESFSKSIKAEYRSRAVEEFTALRRWGREMTMVVIPEGVVETTTGGVEEDLVMVDWFNRKRSTGQGSDHGQMN